MDVLTRFALNFLSLMTFCLVLLDPNMLITSIYLSLPTPVALTHVIGAKLEVPSSLYVPMMNDGWTHIEYTGSTDLLFIFYLRIFRHKETIHGRICIHPRNDFRIS